MRRRGKSEPKQSDWGDEEHVRILIDQRKHLWNRDYVALVAKLIGLEAGKSVVDIGCGLGYLGQVFGEYIEPDGKYLGLDHNHKLLLASRKLSPKSPSSRFFQFVQGDCLNLPFPDCSMDISMCQTVLMHLSHPEAAVKEMVRVTKRGGRVVAFEPNNLCWALSSWSNFQKKSVDERIEDAEIYARICEGRRRLGLGDWSIGEKVPHIFLEQGLKNIQVRQNDKVSSVVVPPYDGTERKHACALLCDRISGEAEKTRSRKLKDYTEGKEFYVAGGGDEKVYQKYMRRRRAWVRKNHRKLLQMAKRGELYDIWSVPFYVIIGEKE